MAIIDRENDIFRCPCGVRRFCQNIEVITHDPAQPWRDEPMIPFHSLRCIHCGKEAEWVCAGHMPVCRIIDAWSSEGRIKLAANKEAMLNGGKWCLFHNCRVVEYLPPSCDEESWRGKIMRNGLT